MRKTDVCVSINALSHTPSHNITSPSTHIHFHLCRPGITLPNITTTDRSAFVKINLVTSGEAQELGVLWAEQYFGLFTFWQWNYQESLSEH